MRKEFLQIVEEITTNDKEILLTPRKLLGYFHLEKRTKGNISRVSKFLNDKRLETIPDFTSVWIDSQITLKHKKKAKSSKNVDPIQRIKLLDASNKALITVNRDSKLKEAITLMMLHNYSQLPVMNGPKSVVGYISWETIGYGLSNGCKSEDVRDFMLTDFVILDYETPLLEAISIIIKKEFIIVQKQDRSVCGIITIADISAQFLTVSEPFILLEQIENHLRQILDGKFLIQELKDFCRVLEIDREIENIDNLNFGDYIRILEKPDHWERFKLTIDRVHFIKQLDKVREIRNDIMHFDPEGITDVQRDDLYKMAKFLKEIRKFS
ncbi:CBS domain-containing protein [uncultured Algoriphagus sp.]|uniref:CBS domain-containing protein n=1 Tax=uncultured Algoriphagus sp. TaxID=417365 RepID=UPI0030ED91D1|tara:strand:+ start:7458 stop:8432 length:975 start_codon:yes stop_codon:yes gene_type:complete